MTKKTITRYEFEQLHIIKEVSLKHLNYLKNACTHVTAITGEEGGATGGYSSAMVRGEHNSIQGMLEKLGIDVAAQEGGVVADSESAPADEWYWTTDDESWTSNNGPFASAEAAYEAGLEDSRSDLSSEDWGSVFWTGRKNPWIPKISGDYVIEELNTDACDNVSGDAVDDWPGASGEQVAELGRMLTETFNSWMKKYHHEPKFWGIDDITKHEIRE